MLTFTHKYFVTKLQQQSAPVFGAHPLSDVFLSVSIIFKTNLVAFKHFFLYKDGGSGEQNNVMMGRFLVFLVRDVSATI